MKKTIVSLFICFLVISVHFSCKKKEAVPDPEPDPFIYSSDLQGSKDISLMSMMVSDLEMMCSFMTENSPPKFYLPTASSSATVYPDMDSTKKWCALSFKNTSCVDGKVRNGSIFIDYSMSAPNVRYVHEYGFECRIYLSNHTSDGWRIEHLNGQPLTMTSQVSPSTYNPANTNLTWKISGKLKFVDPLDTTRYMTWDGNFTKTLVNTSNPSVFNPNKQMAIQWPLAVINYTGIASGYTSGNVVYNLSIGSVPVKRDFNCYFVPPNSTEITEFHPFTNGVVVFNSSNFDPRNIDYGPQEPGPCDNKGVISFKGETHNFDFE